MKINLTIGRILKARGLKGEVKFETYSGNSERYKELKTVKLDGVDYSVEKISSDGEFGYVKLGGVDTIEQAEALRGKEMTARRDDLPKLSADRFYIADLLGLDVYVAGDRIGEMVDVLQYGSADVYVIKLETGSVSVPAIADVVDKIDLVEGKIVLNDRTFGRVAVYN
ncbi:MAG: ribosome maturation factor RimM [Clostridia bacterium]